MPGATERNASLSDPNTFPPRPPEWYLNAKFGIFIHWGPASVPAWAYRTTLNTQEMIKEKGLTYYFKYNPYSIWYFNTMRIPGSPTQEHHKQAWGDQPYEIFGEKFREMAANGEYFAHWAKVFQHSGARYVVPVTKHHDGFTLWPTKVPHRKKGWGAEVDLIGKLREQVVGLNMRFGVYYSGMYDWSWNSVGIRNALTADLNGYQSRESVAYMDSHVRELIGLYKPDVLWNDIGYLTHPDETPKDPAAFRSLTDLWNYYYDNVPTGVTDDRWYEAPFYTPFVYSLFSMMSRFFAQPVSLWVSGAIDWILKLVNPDYDKPPTGLTFPSPAHWDYRTFEYDVPDEIQPGKWELVRGVGLAFCYNRNEDPTQWLTFHQLVDMFVDLVSKNGNLLLNIGPMADGTLQPHEEKLLMDFGDWMKTYGAALYDTTPWSVLAPDAYKVLDATSFAGDRLIRFTVLDGILNVFFRPLDDPEVLIPNVEPDDQATVSLWLQDGGRLSLKWRKDGSGTWLTMPADPPNTPVQCVSVSPVPGWTG